MIVEGSWPPKITGRGWTAAAKTGFVYLLTNLAFPNWVRVGRTTGAFEKRLYQHNNSDPERRYEVLRVAEWHDIIYLERRVLLRFAYVNMAAAKTVLGSHPEWVKMTEAMAAQEFDYAVATCPHDREEATP